LFNELHVDDVVFDHNLAMITVCGEGMNNSVGVAARAAGAFSRAGINIEMISQGCSEVSMFFAVNGIDEKNAVQALYDEFFGQAINS
jgi:aspartate kinase